MLSIVRVNYGDLGVVGDFKAAEFLEMLGSMDFIQHVNGPTHNCGHMLDLVITHGLRINIYSEVNRAISDHHFFSMFLASPCHVTE